MITTIYPSNPRCQAQSCPNVALSDCTYCDRTGNRCQTSWCASHFAKVNGQPYCERHVNLMRALASSPDAAILPPVGNRSASLVTWVANRVDTEIRQLLAGLADPEQSEKLVVEPLTRRHHLLHGGGHYWERSWKLISHLGVAVKVTLEVNEATDELVVIRVGGATVMRSIPPWVEDHAEDIAVSAIDAKTAADAYYDLLVGSLRGALKTERRVDNIARAA